MLVMMLVVLAMQWPVPCLLEPCQKQVTSRLCAWSACRPQSVQRTVQGSGMLVPKALYQKYTYIACMQILMAIFSYCYYWSYISAPEVTVGDVLTLAGKLSDHDQVRTCYASYLHYG